MVLSGVESWPDTASSFCFFELMERSGVGGEGRVVVGYMDTQIITDVYLQISPAFGQKAFH